MELHILGKHRQTLGEITRAAILYDTFRIAIHKILTYKGKNKSELDISIYTQNKTRRLTYIPITMSQGKARALIDIGSTTESSTIVPTKIKISMLNNKQIKHLGATSSSRHPWLPMNTGFT